ncbi:MAG: DinB family protein [Bacteroidia bacterium]
MEFHHFVAGFRHALEENYTSLSKIADAEASVRPAPGKWSGKEIIGHLIDSAIINQQRFVRAQFQHDLVFYGYDQDKFVEMQHYNELSWISLLQMWRLLNLHIAWVMEVTPSEIRQRRIEKHSLDKIAWHAVPPEEATSLEYFMTDYVRHMKHHLAQVKRTP